MRYCPTSRQESRSVGYVILRALNVCLCAGRIKTIGCRSFNGPLFSFLDAGHLVTSRFWGSISIERDRRSAQASAWRSLCRDPTSSLPYTPELDPEFCCRRPKTVGFFFLQFPLLTLIPAPVCGSYRNLTQPNPNKPAQASSFKVAGDVSKTLLFPPFSPARLLLVSLAVSCQLCVLRHGSPLPQPTT